MFVQIKIYNSMLIMKCQLQEIDIMETHIRNESMLGKCI